MFLNLTFEYNYHRVQHSCINLAKVSPKEIVGVRWKQSRLLRQRQNYEQDYLDKQEYLLLHFLFIHADFGQFL